MICLEISINGEKVCLAGVGATGVVSAHVTWTKRRTEHNSSEESQDKTTGENLFCMVGGLAHKDDDHSSHLHWLYQKIRVGDEVTIRVINAETPDQPFEEKEVFDGCAFCGKSPSKELKIVVS